MKKSIKIKPSHKIKVIPSTFRRDLYSKRLSKKERTELDTLLTTFGLEIKSKVHWPRNEWNGKTVLAPRRAWQLIKQDPLFGSQFNWTLECRGYKLHFFNLRKVHEFLSEIKQERPLESLILDALNKKEKYE